MRLDKNVFVGRQPIFDRKLDVVAYELLFRNDSGDAAMVTNGERATMQLLASTFTEIGLDRIAGGRRVFVNVTRNFLLGGYPLPPPESGICLEVLENTVIDDRLVEHLRTLAEKGYPVVLDDFVYQHSWEDLMDIASIIKIDILALGRRKTELYANAFKERGLEVLAEKVETQEDFHFCKALGFDYFQGFFLCRPNVVEGRRAPYNRLAVVHLLGVLENPKSTPRQVEEALSLDPSLGYRLLRVINSARPNGRRVSSLRDALEQLEPDEMRHWVRLLVLAGVEEKSHSLMVTALVRAKMCELLATRAGQENSEAYFTVGLMSVLDAMLDAPMPEVLESLPVTDEISDALLYYSGPIGRALSCTLAYERGDFEHVDCGRGQEFIELYLEAIGFADRMGEKLAA